MNRTEQKSPLFLNKETFRVLTDQEGEHVAGGDNTSCAVASCNSATATAQVTNKTVKKKTHGAVGEF